MPLSCYFVSILFVVHLKTDTDKGCVSCPSDWMSDDNTEAPNCELCSSLQLFDSADRQIYFWCSLIL